MRRCWIRADASKLIGTGHIYRCLSMASSLKKQAIDVRFVCRTLDGHLCALIESQGFRVVRLPADLNNQCLDYSNLADDTLLKGIQSNLPHAHWLEASQSEDALAFI